MEARTLTYLEYRVETLEALVVIVQDSVASLRFAFGLHALMLEALGYTVLYYTYDGVTVPYVSFPIGDIVPIPLVDYAVVEVR